MRIVLINILLLIGIDVTGQDPLNNRTSKTDSFALNRATSKNYKPEIFTSGFIDIVNNGQINASARFIRLFIGEPGKFALPLSLYSGVSANNFQGSPNTSVRNNETTAINLINPLAG